MDQKPDFRPTKNEEGYVHQLELGRLHRLDSLWPVTSVGIGKGIKTEDEFKVTQRRTTSVSSETKSDGN